MRTSRRTLGVALTAVAITSLVACSNLYEEVYRPLTDPELTTTGTGGSDGTTSSDPRCIPRKNTSAVADDCGVFVSSSLGSDDGDGSQTNPYLTIAKALGSPTIGAVYLCAETFPEAVHITAGRTIYGGLDCTKKWAWSSTKKSEISPDGGAVPLVVDPQISLVLSDVTLRAKDATQPGGSSIGMIATSAADVTLIACDVEAGNAKDGATEEDPMTLASAGTTGKDGADACTTDVVIGGKSVTSACDDADMNDDSISGLGGIGTDSSGGNGTDGQPGTAINGGKGEKNMTACSIGTAGDNGGSSASALGATGMGSINAQGYTGVAGPDGEKGKPGQGGGGGGGAKGGSGMIGLCSDALSAGGASGGSGGSGGCGGAGGKGGQAGGASIGIVLLDAKLTFTDTLNIKSSAAGKGGGGGNGQLGGMGGVGGTGGKKGAANALKNGCSGGPGGSGGAGGKGGGGTGGHSIGIAYTGDAPNTNGATITISTPGEGGLGDGDTGTGSKGLAAPTQAF